GSPAIQASSYRRPPVAPSAPLQEIHSCSCLPYALLSLSPSPIVASDTLAIRLSCGQLVLRDAGDGGGGQDPAAGAVYRPPHWDPPPQPWGQAPCASVRP
ncbi:unnamed protein product, partial [Urochloa humidicola]